MDDPPQAHPKDRIEVNWNWIEIKHLLVQPKIDGYIDYRHQ